MEILYEAEMKSVAPRVVLADLPLQPEAFTSELVEGVEDAREALDASISARLRADWTLERLSMLDQLVLRLGVYELHRGETPVGVVLSEAVELATRYGGAESARFVNGVLAAVAGDDR